MDGGHPLRAWVRCDCGVEKSVQERFLRKGMTRSCGCLAREPRGPRRVVDPVGERYGRLVVTQRFPRGRVAANCDCGQTWEGLLGNLRHGSTTSCGCAPTGRFSHGRSNTPEWTTWIGIKQRCENPNSAAFHRYGGRGITICARWREDFAAFLADMGERPSADLSVDRIDNDKGYWCGKPECAECGPAGRAPNCRWATAREQSRNTRRTSWLTINGERVPACDVYSANGITKQTFFNRVNSGWSETAAATTQPDAERVIRSRRIRYEALARKTDAA